MSEFKKFGPLVDEKGLGWVFSASSIPAPIQEQVKDWFYYRRINDASEDKFQRMFKRKLFAVEPRFLALMSAQAMEIDPLVQEMFEATVAATREGKTIVNETGTETATGEGSNTQHRTGNNTSNTSTIGESSGTSKVTTNSDVSGNDSTTHTIDENGSDSTTHTGGEARADSAYPESALSTPGPLPTPDTITLTHLANMTVNNRNSHDGTLSTRKGNNKDEGTRSSHTEGVTDGRTSGNTSGRSEGTVETSEDITGSNTSNNSITRGRDSTTTNDGKDSSTTTNKGRHMSAQELLSKYLDFIYRCDAILWFVNELEGCFLAVYDDSGVDCFVWDEDGKDGKDGKDGVTFVPHTQVLSDGVRIYWTNDGGLPNPDPVEVKNGMDASLPEGVENTVYGTTGTTGWKKIGVKYSPDSQYTAYCLGLYNGGLIRLDSRAIVQTSESTYITPVFGEPVEEEMFGVPGKLYQLTYPQGTNVSRSLYTFLRVHLGSNLGKKELRAIQMNTAWYRDLLAFWVEEPSYRNVFKLWVNNKISIDPSKCQLAASSAFAAALGRSYSNFPEIVPIDMEVTE